MGRMVRRVPLDFDWPIGKVWPGFCMSPCDDDCEGCRQFAKIMNFNTTEGGCPTLDFLEPPKGDGWQLWETVSEGSPMSPVFKTAEELARWLADNKASAFADMTATYEQWLAMIREGSSVTAVATPEGLKSGVEAISEKIKRKGEGKRWQE